MEDADEAVAECAEGLMVQIPVGAVLVVEGASTRTSGQCTERPLVESIVETFVADVAGQHCTFAARRDGQW